MKKFLVSLIIVLLLNGCSSDDSQIENSIISNGSQFSVNYARYETFSRQSDYETDTEYEIRIEDYIEEIGQVSYKIGLTDSYDIETETLTVYYRSKDYSATRQEFWMLHSYTSVGEEEFHTNYVSIWNYYDFSIPVEIYENDIDDKIFYQINISPSEAEELHNGFYLLVETILFYNDYDFTSRRDYLDWGDSYFIDVSAISMELRNSYDINLLVEY